MAHTLYQHLLIVNHSQLFLLIPSMAEFHHFDEDFEHVDADSDYFDTDAEKLDCPIPIIVLLQIPII